MPTSGNKNIQLCTPKAAKTAYTCFWAYSNRFVEACHVTLEPTQPTQLGRLGKNMKATKCLCFDLNSKVIVTILCEHKLHMRTTTSLYYVIQLCQVNQIFIFYLFYHNLKENYHIRKKKI